MSIFKFFDLVTAKEAKRSKLIIGVQFGFLGFIIRLGLYKDK